jgi:hypothetical protein
VSGERAVILNSIQDPRLSLFLFPNHQLPIPSSKRHGFRIGSGMTTKLPTSNFQFLVFSFQFSVFSF